MVKIKTKKEMNLPQLIEWGCKNDIMEKKFPCKELQQKGVYFNRFGHIEFNGDWSYSANDTFAVLTEEQITRDTKLPKLLAIFKYNERTYSEIHENKSINEILQLDRKLENSFTRSIHMFEEDDSLTLLWKNGKLVE